MARLKIETHHYNEIMFHYHGDNSFSVSYGCSTTSRNKNIKNISMDYAIEDTLAQMGTANSSKILVVFMFLDIINPEDDSEQ
jgi:hypothetical protein